MDGLNLLNGLNDKQCKAVTTLCKSLLVLAGAGSGKTRVLVHRIAWLLSKDQYLPHSIMAVTFTNKAADEMLKRIEMLIGDKYKKMWIGTFHGLTYRMLRKYYIDAGLPQHFQIIDNDDQLRILKRVIKSMNLDEKKLSIRKILWYINHKKEEGIRPSKIINNINRIEKIRSNIYEEYQKICDRAGLVDFAELILRTYNLLLNNPHILHYYRTRFCNILVDEFQDINKTQYAWIRMLVGNDNRIIIVGDDDQSIYGWRGADIENIQNFLKDFPDSETIRLEQNYRSTNNIIKASNSLISNNKDRLGKILWTNVIDGEPIKIYCAIDELDEARFIVNNINLWYKNNNLLSHCAVLYRSNCQSRVIEDALLHVKLPYRVYGGLRFFERKEIKNVLSYLRLIINRNDDSSFERIINIPRRGIGNGTLNVIRYTAQIQNLTLWQASNLILQSKELVGRSAIALQNFCYLIESLAVKIIHLPLHIQVDHVIKDSGLFLMYQQEEENYSRARIENLNELLVAMRQFNFENKPENRQDNGMFPLKEFLSHVSLSTEESLPEKTKDAVQLMTLHSAKGLEFNIVFIIGMEEGLFPHQMSLNEVGGLEEERRLAYVGMTRAINKLTLSYVKIRKMYGKEIYTQPSRFIYELPTQCLKKALE